MVKRKAADTTELWGRLERLVLEWKTLDPKSEAARRSLNFEMTEVILSLFPNQDAMETMGMFWTTDLDKYDPKQGNFRGFVLGRLKFRKKDMRHRDLGEHRVLYEENGEKRQAWVGALPLDQPMNSEDDSTAIGDQVADPDNADGQANLEAEALLQELITLILLLPHRLSGQSKNPTKINYYRMFFTDGTVAGLHEVGERPYLAHERDLFSAMKLPFLDFFMEKCCRTVGEIMDSPLKVYGQMVEGRPMTVPDQPLPNNVYMQYLNTVEGMELKSASTITNQRMAYRTFLKENLC